MAFSENVFSVRRLFVFAAFFATIALRMPKTITALPVVPGSMDTRSSESTSRQQRQKRDVSVTKTDCAAPSNLQDEFQKINAELDRTNFLQTAWGGHALNVTLGVTGSSHHDDHQQTFIDVDLNENKSCPGALTHDAQAPLRNRSLCPYYFRIWRLPDGFYPPTLQTAACKCQRCLEMRQHTCKAVKTQMAVLKPVGCFQGMQRYEEFHLQVNTACVCAVDAVTGSETVLSSGFVE